MGFDPCVKNLIVLPFKADCGEMIHRTNVKSAAENVQRNATIDRQSNCIPEISNTNLKYVYKITVMG